MSRAERKGGVAVRRFHVLLAGGVLVLAACGTTHGGGVAATEAPTTVAGSADPSALETTTTALATTTTVVKTASTVLADGSLLYQGEAFGLPEWFGGVQLGIRDVSGGVIGSFVNEDTGPRDFYSALLAVILEQGEGRYGYSTEDVATYLEEHDGLVKIRLVEPTNETGNYRRIPPWVQKTDEFIWDLKKPVLVELVTRNPAGENIIPLYVASYDWWFGFGITDGQLRLFDRMYAPDTHFADDAQYDFLSFSFEIFALLELMAEANTVSRANGKDFINEVLSRIGGNQFGENPDLVRLEQRSFYMLSGSLSDATTVKVVVQMFDYLSGERCCGRT